MFDYMFSSDIFVDDMARQAGLLVDHLGLHPPGPKAIVTDSPEAHATMLRLNKAFTEAPTRLEIIQPAGTAGHWNVAHIQEAWRTQRDRPVRFHNNVVVGDVDAHAERFSRQGTPHVIDGTLRFRRLFVGISPDRIGTYDPSFDAGLRFELLPFADFPVDAPRANGDSIGGEPRVVRVQSRSFLVDDLDGTVKTIARTFGWHTPAPIHAIRADGVRRALYTFNHDRSARLELLQPMRTDSEAARFLADHGPGPYTTTFLAAGVDRWIERLARTGVTGRRVADHDDYGPRVVIDPGPIGPIRCELVAAS